MTLTKFMVRWILTFAVLTAALSHTYAYEVTTHIALSENAAKVSANLTGQLTNFGLSSITEQLQQGVTTISILDWIREGAKREDDTLTEVFARYKNHFYDPVNDRGFGGILYRNSGFITGMPAPDWALEDSVPASGQIYSFHSARQYMYDGLTKADKASRESNLALMYRSVGDVMHLVQDMAQPQHTRNDGHGDGSLYEQYTNRADVRTNVLTYSSVLIPAVAKARDFFTNSSGTGLAQYSNKNFVSAGTNFSYLNGTIQKNSLYQYPIPTNQIESVSVQDLDFSPAIKEYCGQNCTIRFISSVNDLGETQPRASTDLVNFF